MKTTLEEHHVMVGEPEGFYLDHFCPPNGKGQTLAFQILHSAIKDTKLEQKLAFIESDGTSMTKDTNGLIAALERDNYNVLFVYCTAWSLPFCYVFTALDGSTTSPDSFIGPLGKKVEESISTWQLKNLNPFHINIFQYYPRKLLMIQVLFNIVLTEFAGLLFLVKLILI